MYICGIKFKIMEKRAIKFRAWDDKQRYMAYQGTPELETLQSFIFYFGNGELMQFTGLLDKNGKEIYEGDVVKSPDMTCLAYVVYNHYSFVLFAKDTTYDYFDYYENFEVVGNIYENKDLLK